MIEEPEDNQDDAQDPTTNPDFAPLIPDLPDVPHFEGFAKLDKDLRGMSQLMSRLEAQYIVARYYQLQDLRIASLHQTAVADKVGIPAALLRWHKANMDAFERDHKKAFLAFVSQYRVGNWLMSIRGIGPVIAAGALAMLDVPPPETVGKWWRFAGLDPTVKWRKNDEALALIAEVAGTAKKLTNGHLEEIAKRINMNFGHLVSRLAQENYTATNREHLKKFLCKRPWHARLKMFSAYKLGSSFMLVSKKPDDFYGKLYLQRKQYETEKNDRREYADQAAKSLARVGAGTACAKHNKDGRLSPLHISNRARRWTAKLCLSHIHEVFYRDFYGKAPPAPFIFSKANHTHYIPPPNWPYDGPGKSLKEMAGLELEAAAAVARQELKKKGKADKPAKGTTPTEE